MQLVAYGAQDIYLTGNPQITFFKVVYRRHTNFSMESIEQTYSGTATALGHQDCTISRNGDLITNIWIEDNPTNGKSDGLAYSFIDNIECLIGGQLIDKHTGDWNAIWWNMTTPESKVNGLRNSLVRQSGVDSNGTMYYPLNFWFCRNPGLALPLIALQYHEVKLRIKYASNPYNINSPKLWVNYIYLDTDERRRFAQISHEYLIEQVQINTFSDSDESKSFNLNFNHPIKELFFVNATNSTNYDSQFAPFRCDQHTVAANEKNNYKNADDTNMKLQLNGHDRFTKRNMKYFKICQPLLYHTRVPEGKRYTITNYVTNTNSSGTSIHSLTKPSRLLSATINVVVDSGVAGTLQLVSSDGSNTSSQFISNDITVLSNSFEPSTSGLNTSLDFDLNYDDNRVCIPDGKHIGLNGSKTDAELNITLELEELPLLIGGNSNNLGNIYCYSFALKPEEHQPSGTCNFSRIDNAQLIFDEFPSGNGCVLKVFAVNYNVLRIMSGMGGLAYSN